MKLFVSSTLIGVSASKVVPGVPPWKSRNLTLMRIMGRDLAVSLPPYKNPEFRQLWKLWDGMSLCSYLLCDSGIKGIRGILERDVAVSLPPVTLRNSRDYRNYGTT